MADTKHDHLDAGESLNDYEHDASVAHEHSDVNIRAISAFIIGLFVLGLIVALALYFLMGFYQQQAAAADPAVSPLAVPSGTLPPEPRLLTNEPAALAELHREEDGQLKDIDRAKKEVLGTLPTREGAKTPPESPARAASRMDTSSGRRR